MPKVQVKIPFKHSDGRLDEIKFETEINKFPSDSGKVTWIDSPVVSLIDEKPDYFYNRKSRLQFHRSENCLNIPCSLCKSKINLIIYTLIKDIFIIGTTETDRGEIKLCHDCVMEIYNTVHNLAIERSKFT